MCSIFTPDFANAMGSSEMSIRTVLIITAVTVGIAVGVMYALEWSDAEKAEIKKELIKCNLLIFGFLTRNL